MIFESDKSAGVKAGSGEEPTADDLVGFVKGMGLMADNLVVEVKNGEVKVSGEAEDQSMLEKIAVAAVNVVGVTKVDTSGAVVATGKPASSMHVVKSGDTLWAIAQKTLGDGNRYPEIFEANRPMLSDPNKIYPGQVLLIPAG